MSRPKIAGYVLALAMMPAFTSTPAQPLGADTTASGALSALQLARTAQNFIDLHRFVITGLGGTHFNLAVSKFEAHLMLALHAVEPAKNAWHRVGALAAQVHDVSTQLEAFEHQAEMTLLLGDYKHSRLLAESLLAAARQAHSNEYESTALGYFGVIARRQGDLDSALENYTKAIELLANGGNEFRLALLKSNLGTVFRDRGNFARALELQLEALAIRERIGDHLETSLRNIALLYREIEDEATARSYFDRAIDSVDARVNPESYAPLLGSYASLLNDIGEHAGALAAANEALAIDIALGNRANQALERLEAGRALSGLGQGMQATQQLETALSDGRELGQREIVARALLHLAEINQAEHHPLRARGMIDEAIAGLEAAQLRPQLAMAYAIREKIALAEHDPEAALRYLRRYAEQRELLLGTLASRQLGNLQARNARLDAEKNVVLLQKDNELQAARLDKQEVQKQLASVALISLGLALLLTIWRFLGVRQLNRTLQLKNAEIDAKGKELAEANKKLEERAADLYNAAISDPLTGVYNRSHLRLQTGRRLSDCRLSGSPLVLLVIDFDRFKQVNDQFGHLFGDRVLLTGVAAMQQCLEETDIIGRFGGEEFVVVLAGDRATSAAAIAEQIRMNVQDKLLSLEVYGRTLSVSIGLATLDDLAESSESSVDALLNAADQAMYMAKAGGRNRVANFNMTAPAVEQTTDERTPANQ